MFDDHVKLFASINSAAGAEDFQNDIDIADGTINVGFS